ncbi:D-beta-hydroxybutyrate dehydrogenase, mitochondrial-like [Penaeus japonicus]|uniref:D-beta-hydroxybutyrate dehydrogenase, mitochondrial-like n=1 Tax=Penaeus japonicus TaxID=27405 RepID=UPI001C711C42|nr:D-beta-hydroxybutyrate dehydrogenase, mitochondrial-like [Penaeus japonicus]
MQQPCVHKHRTKASHLDWISSSVPQRSVTRHQGSSAAEAVAAMAVTYDKAARVLFWGGVSFVLASLLTFVGLVSWWLTFLASWTLASATYLALASLKVLPEGKAVLITGCDSGFGYATALFLDRMGFRVFACCLLAHSGGEGAQRLRREGSRRLHVLQLDVTKQEQIDSALENVKNLLPPGEVLWGLVNNAGINPYGAVEWVSVEDYRKTCEVNLFGTIAVTKSFLPLIRRAKGRVVNVGSVRGRMTSPLGAVYEVTKYGVEAFSDCLRHEMRRFGVDVSIIEPGNFAMGTSIYKEEYILRFSEKMWEEMSDEVKADYRRKLSRRSSEAPTSGLEDWARGRERGVGGDRRGADAAVPAEPLPADTIFYYVMVFVSQHFPEWLYDYLCVEYLRK